MAANKGQLESGTINLKELLSTHNMQAQPYSKSLKIKIMDTSSDWTQYTRMNQGQGHYLKFTAADRTSCVRGIAYDKPSQEKLLKEGKNLLLRNFQFANQQLKITANTRIFNFEVVFYRCEQITVPEEVKALMTAGNIKTVAGVHTSPVKATVSVLGTVTKDEATKTVEVGSSGKPSQVKEITICDTTGEVKCSLWNEMTKIDMKCGDKIKLEDGIVKFSPFHNENTLSVNALSKITVIEATEDTQECTIVAANVLNNSIVSLMVQTDIQKELKCTMNIICTYLNIESPDTCINEDTFDEHILPQLPIECNIKLKGDQILEITPRANDVEDTSYE